MEIIALALGLFGTTLIGIAVSLTDVRRPRLIAAIGTMFVGVAFILALLVLLKVVE